MALINELRDNIAKWRSRRDKVKAKLVLPSILDPGVYLVLIVTTFLLPALHLQPGMEQIFKFCLGIPAAAYAAITFVHRFAKDPEGGKRSYVARLDRMIAMAEAWTSELLPEDVKGEVAKDVIRRMRYLHLILRPDAEKI